MNVKKIIPQGYCKGVYNAIKIAIETKKENPNENIYILGLIIHNKLIKEELDKLNIQTLTFKNKTKLEILDEINDGIVILTAHGTEREIFEKLEKKKLKYVDTTCNYVKSTYEIINQELKLGHEVIYIGIKNHPEALATISLNRNKVHLIENEEDLKNIKLEDDAPLITNQTTLSYDLIKQISEKIINIYPKARLSNEQCSATRLRQSAIINSDDNFDLILVVGDFLSNNSLQLTKLAKAKTEAYLIESLDDLDTKWLENKHNIGVTSGASTPSSLVDEIIEFIKNYDGKTTPKHQKDLNILKEFKI